MRLILKMPNYSLYLWTDFRGEGQLSMGLPGREKSSSFAGGSKGKTALP
jgi:hypothetical protein